MRHTSLRALASALVLDVALPAAATAADNGNAPATLSFDFRLSLPSPFSLRYPRLVVTFSDGGNASLRPLTWTTSWQPVTDPNWDNNAGGCGYRFQQTWQQIQACHPGTYITNEYITTDPGGPEVDFYIDNLETAGKVWGEAADDGDGDNTAAFFTPNLLSLLLG